MLHDPGGACGVAPLQQASEGVVSNTEMSLNSMGF